MNEKYPLTSEQFEKLFTLILQVSNTVMAEAFLTLPIIGEADPEMVVIARERIQRERNRLKENAKIAFVGDK